jgi:tRNA(Arg) A34 adenosine deaminase TadA
MQLHRIEESKKSTKYIINEVIKAPRAATYLSVAVIVAFVDSDKVRGVLDTINIHAPLETYSLSHFKRIRGNSKRKKSESTEKALLQILICREIDFDTLHHAVTEAISPFRREVMRVCAWEPDCRIEFDNWNQSWPMHYHPSQSERDRDKGFTLEETEFINQILDILNKEETNEHAIIINPLNNKIITTSTKYSKQINHESNLLNNPIKTPTILCIDGVAAMLRGDIEDIDKSLPESHYLCSGLDLYLRDEPDLLSSMALVHSRIRRVFFMFPKENHENPGALLTAYHLHLLPSLNHHYRVFSVNKK